MSTNVPSQLEGTATTPRSYIASELISTSITNVDEFDEWMELAWCSKETIRRLCGV